MSNYSPDYIIGLVEELRKLPSEAEWAEFKTSYDNTEGIGEYISALSNSAALLGKTKAYLLWGVHDTTHEIIGTTFHPTKCKVGNELLENWVLQRLSPKINFRFFDCVIAEKPLVLMEIDPAFKHPVQFQHQPYIRIGSYKKKLKDYPEKERELWRALDRTPFETQAAMERQSADQVLQLLDCPSFFELLNLPLPNGHQAILDALTQHGLVTMCPAGGFNITNLGAILIARSINEFPTLKRKALRVVQYKGISRIETQREQIGAKGYACGFEGLIGFITAMLPANEFIGNALRSSVPMYPELAIRELVANALIHQDFFETGSGPMIELFDDRMEITNPGLPLVAVERFLDTPPKSRNEALASMMRHFGICEERGSGIDKVVTQTELFQLPAPIFEVSSGFTRTVLFSHKSLEDMTKEDRVRACYQHSCLQYVQRKKMTNTSLRERFGIDESKSAQVSRIIAATVEAGLVVPDPMSESRRDAAYIPFWSSSKELGT